MPAIPKDFLRAALQRLTVAAFLQSHGYNLDATYLAGYAIECSLKAVILQLTPPAARQRTLALITAGAAMHRPEVLAPLLKALGEPVPLDLVKKYRRFAWTTALRYETGRKRTGEARGFLKAAKATYDWAETLIP